MIITQCLRRLAHYSNYVICYASGETGPSARTRTRYLGTRMPPLWKIYRELDRLRQMLHSFVGLIYEPLIQFWYDRNRNEFLQIIDGDVAESRKTAIVLIYQPDCVRNSLFLTLRHLISKGYAPLLVSNTCIQDSDLSRLKLYSWKIIIRPNFGYDFGGYRDAILWLQQSDVDLSRLLIINDSIWFPVWPNESLIERMEAMSNDMVGVVWHPGRKRNLFSQRRLPFLESYFYIINRPILEGSAFREFWKRYRVSSIKLNAVYRGERSFSGKMELGGHSIGWVLHSDAFLASIGTKSNSFLRKTIEYGAYTDPEYEKEREQLLTGAIDDGEWRAAALEHITRVLQRRSIYSSFPYASFHILSVPFVKKSRLLFFGKSFGTVQIKMRTQLIRAIENNDIPRPFPEIFDEMVAIEPELIISKTGGGYPEDT